MENTVSSMTKTKPGRRGTPPESEWYSTPQAKRHHKQVMFTLDERTIALIARLVEKGIGEGAAGRVSGSSVVRDAIALYAATHRVR